MKTGTEKERLKSYRAIYQQMVDLQNRHWWFRVHYDWIRDILKPYLTPGARVLDMGCGPGVATKNFPEPVFRILLDIRLQALAYCGPGSFARLCSDGASVPLKSESCDVVICSDLLHQCDVREPGRVVGEAFRVCRLGGTILLVEPAFDCLFGPHDEVENGCRRYTTAGLVRLFGDRRVRVLRKTYLHGLMFLPAYLVRHVFGRFSARKETDLTLGNRLTNAVSFRLESLERWLNRLVPFPFGTSAAILVRREKT